MGIEAGNPCQEGDIVVRTFRRGRFACAGQPRRLSPHVLLGDRPGSCRYISRDR
jgi:hypothetical protein